MFPPLGFQKMKPKKNLRNYVGRYIRAKIKMTECMQNHFRQVCHVCKSYSLCSIYSNYIDAWMKLQKAYKRDKKGE